MNGPWVKLLDILTHREQMVQMHTRPLLAIVPTVAHLPEIRLHCYSGLIYVAAKKSVTFIMARQTTATSDLRIMKCDLTFCEKSVIQYC